MRKPRRKRGSLRPGWGVDPDVRGDFSDGAAVARDVKAWRRRGRIRGVVGLLLLGLVAWFLVPSILTYHDQRSDWTRLVRAGGGEVRYMGSGYVRCYATPRLAAKGGIPVNMGARVEVVARERGWALIDRYGNPCWVPEWALIDTPVDWNIVARRGRDHYAKPPEGWYDSEVKAACEVGAASRASCWLSDQMGGRRRLP